MKKDRKVIVYIAMSLDGYIAKPNDGLEWLDWAETPNQDYGYKEFLKKVDTILMGRRTYEVLKNLTPTFPYTEEEVFIIQKNSDIDGPDNVKIASDPVALIKKLRVEEGKDIWINGGATLVQSLMKADLVDEYVLSILPVFLGDGIALFPKNEREEWLELVSTRMYENGLIQLRYRKRKGD